MNIVVPVKMVPDLVEDIEVDASGVALDATSLRLIVSEFDDHAVEQAILIKEASGGEVAVVALDAEGVDDVLYAAAAKGATQLVKLTSSSTEGITNRALARMLAGTVNSLQPQLILCGVQANNDLDGSLGPRLAAELGLPYVGYVAGVTVEGNKATVRKEYPGGLIGQIAVALPAVLGIQAAAKPPRYVPISRIRQVRRTATIRDEEAPEPEPFEGAVVTRMAKPDPAQHATMIEGDVDEVADKLAALLKQLGVL